MNKQQERIGIMSTVKGWIKGATGIIAIIVVGAIVASLVWTFLSSSRSEVQTGWPYYADYIDFSQDPLGSITQVQLDNNAYVVEARDLYWEIALFDELGNRQLVYVPISAIPNEVLVPVLEEETAPLLEQMLNGFKAGLMLLLAPILEFNMSYPVLYVVLCLLWLLPVWRYWQYAQKATIPLSLEDTVEIGFSNGHTASLRFSCRYYIPHAPWRRFRATLAQEEFEISLAEVLAGHFAAYASTIPVEEYATVAKEAKKLTEMAYRQEGRALPVEIKHTLDQFEAVIVNINTIARPSPSALEHLVTRDRMPEGDAIAVGLKQFLEVHPDLPLEVACQTYVALQQSRVEEARLAVESTNAQTLSQFEQDGLPLLEHFIKGFAAKFGLGQGG